MPIAQGRNAWMRSSVYALVLANVVPIFGVFFFGWQVFPLMLLFWAENIVIGIFNVVKMIMANPGGSRSLGVKIFLVPFFCFHYGLFALVHGMFVVGLFGGTVGRTVEFPDGTTIVNLVREQNLHWAIFGLAVSHGISLTTNYLARREYLRTTPMQLMAQPYGRVMVLQVTLILGGFIMLQLHSPTAGLVLLVLLKIALDLRSHLREHRKLQTEGTTIAASPFQRKV